METEHAATEHGAEIVHVCAGVHPSDSMLVLFEECRYDDDIPESNTVIIGPNDSSLSADAVSIHDTFHHVEVQFPILLRSRLFAVLSLYGVHDDFVVLESLGEGEGGLLVLTLVEHTYRIGSSGRAGARCL